MIDSFIRFLRRPRVVALIIVSVFALLIYGTAQLIIRGLADDPQVQIATETAAGLSAGLPAASIAPTPGKTLEQTQSPFVVVFDMDGNAIAGSALYKNALPMPPKGIFAHSLATGTHRVTWQPAHDLRFATVIAHYKSANAEGYVLAGKSLRESERRVGRVGCMVFVGWLASVLLLYLTSLTAVKHVRHISKHFRRK